MSSAQRALRTTQTRANYDRGYAAIEKLFPTKDAFGKPITYSGDMDMIFSQLKTEQGGDIDPPGAGRFGERGACRTHRRCWSALKQIVTAQGQPISAAANLGILVLSDGAIHGFTDQSFKRQPVAHPDAGRRRHHPVGQQRGIDAGKGAKSASGAPPPVIPGPTRNGNTFVNPSNAVVGSGIGQLLTSADSKAGLVNLMAPKGVINAGDAGSAWPAT